MRLLLVMLLAQQGAPLPTVGDTVWISRSLSVAAGVTVRPRPVVGSAAAEPLGPPEVVRIDREVRIRYPLVAWQPGRHTITVPGPILVRADGWSDTLPAGTATIEVGSILPDLPRDSLQPHDALTPIERTRRSVLPVSFLLLVLALVLVPVHWWWGRRGPATPVARPVIRPGPSEAMLAAWLAAGEYRAAIEGWHHRLVSLGAGKGLDPEGQVVLDRLSAARFGPLERDSVTALCDAAGRWLEARSA